MLSDLRNRIRNKERIEALWTPFWYAGDQALHGAIWDHYRMVCYQCEKTDSAFSNHAVDAILYSEQFPSYVHYGKHTLLNTFELCGRIIGIRSRTLGELLGLTYHHFDYYLTLSDGSLLTMNCEEHLGRIYEREITLDKFDLLVTIDVKDFDDRPVDWNALDKA